MTTDTKFADVSEFQPDVNDAYPYRFLSIRSNDGTYRDHHLALNLAWCKHACDSNRMDGFVVYFVFEENWRQTIEVFKAMVGRPHRKMAVMIDVESWSGKIRGDHSAEINACRAAVVAWLGSYMTATQRARALHKRRVLGYGNAGDLNTLWPGRGDVRLVLANYSANPDFPGKIAHQYSDREPTAPFGPCDINSADGYTPVQLAAALGLVDPPAPKPVKVPPPGRPARKPPRHRVQKTRTYLVRRGDTFNGIAKRLHVTPARLHSVNPQVADVNRIFVGQHLIRP